MARTAASIAHVSFEETEEKKTKNFSSFDEKSFFSLSFSLRLGETKDRGNYLILLIIIMMRQKERVSPESRV